MKGFLSKHTSEVQFLQRLLDPVVVIGVFSICFAWKELHWTPNETLFIVVITVLVMVVFRRFDLYRSWRGTSILTELRRVFAAWLVVLSLLFSFAYLANVPRSVLTDVLNPFGWITPLLLGFVRFIARTLQRYFRARGRNLRRVIIAGAGDLGEKVARNILRDGGSGIVLVGFFDDRFHEGLQVVDKIPVLGSIEEIPHYVRKHAIDMVYMALPLRAEMKMRELARQLRDTRASLYLVPDIFVFSLLNTRLLDLGGLPVFSLYAYPFSGVDGWVKRIQDIVLATLILILVSPLMLLIAVLLKLTSNGPVLFRQRRYGLLGEEIRIYKFRTMMTCDDGTHILQARRSDPRVTRLGGFLRRTSLDELPQFFNVLKGEMSIVGPRPHAVAHNEYYRNLIDGYMLRHRVKPGITGWAQVNGWRGETDTLEKMQKRVEYDLEYIRNWSFWFDIKIILKTILNGFSVENVY